MPKLDERTEQAAADPEAAALVERFAQAWSKEDPTRSRALIRRPRAWLPYLGVQLHRLRGA